MKLSVIKPYKKIPADFAAQLRQMADDVEAGKVDSAVIAAVIDGNYTFVYPSSLADSLTLSTLLHAECIERFRR